MTKGKQYVREAVRCFIYLFLVAGFCGMIAEWAHAQPVSFVGKPPKTFPAGTNPVSVVRGDFNQDGNQDLAVANRGSNDVSVLLGNGDGTFQPPVNFPVGGSPNSIVMDYFDGDSIQDLAVANGNSISVLLGNANGTFQPALNFPAGPGASSISWGDFNVDHLWDLIVRTDAGFAVHLGNGNGTFRAPLNTPAADNYVAWYFNDDGILDVATTSSGSVINPAVVRVRFGNGDGTFQSPVDSPVPPLTSPNRIAVGYFNRDAIADLMVNGLITAVPRSAILLGNGDGTFRNEGIFLGPGGLVDDFDGDTIADLLIGTSGGFSVALGRGDGTFRSSTISFVGGGSCSGEFNGDGFKDLAGLTTNGVSVLLGYGDGTFHTTWNRDFGSGILIDSNAVAIESATVALGEFNGDGIKDLAVTRGSHLGGTLSVLLGNGDGSFQWAFDYPFAYASTSIAVGEFNGDGIQDLITNLNGVFLGNGNGTFQPPLPISSEGYIAVGFFNGDGFQDVALLGSGADAIAVLLGNGDGTFQAPLSFNTGVLPPSGYPNPRKRSLAVGDFNADGSQDLVATNQTGSVSVLLGNGDGTFRAPLIFNAGPAVLSLAVGDFNNDHIQDLATTNYGPSTIGGGFSILLGNGNGTFGMPLHFALANGNMASIAVGDFNSDGIHDLIVGTGHRFGTDLWVLVGNGDATFQPPVDVSVGVTGASFAIGLLSGDGRPDIAVGGCARIPIIEGEGICVDRVSLLINNTR